MDESKYLKFLKLFESDVKKNQLIYNNSPILREHDYIKGVAKLNEFITFCLVLISDTFPYTELQYEAFLKTIPIVLPLLFGKEFYISFNTELNETLGTLHNKLCYWFIGSRRDGKSIFQASIAAALFCICENNDKESIFIPFLGPGENTGIRLNENIRSILALPRVKNKYDSQITFNNSQKKLISINKNTKQVIVGRVLAPTPTALRGINSRMDFIDETEWISVEVFNKLFITRYKESGVPCLSITTPNINSEYYRKFCKSSSVIESENKARICDSCIEGISNADTFNEAMEKCQKLGHVEPPNVPWISKELDEGWSIYQPPDIYSSEHAGVVISEDIKQFHPRVLTKFFNQIVEFPYSGYSHFFAGFDPSDYGKSETSVWFMGYRNGIFHVLFGNSYLVRDEQSVADMMFEDIRYFVDVCRKLEIMPNGSNVWKSPKTALFVETFGHHMFNIQQKIEYNGYIDFMKVIKGNNIRNKNPFEWRYGVPKTKPYTEAYVSNMRKLLGSNRLKISKHFFTRNRAGKQAILDKLHKQMKSLIRNKQGKITGKNSGNDDCICALMMIPENARKCFLFNHPYSIQFRTTNYNT